MPSLIDNHYPIDKHYQVCRDETGNMFLAETTEPMKEVILHMSDLLSEDFTKSMRCDVKSFPVHSILLNFLEWALTVPKQYDRVSSKRSTVLNFLEWAPSVPKRYDRV